VHLIYAAAKGFAGFTSELRAAAAAAAAAHMPRIPEVPAVQRAGRPAEKPRRASAAKTATASSDPVADMAGRKRGTARPTPPNKKGRESGDAPLGTAPLEGVVSEDEMLQQLLKMSMSSSASTKVRAAATAALRASQSQPDSTHDEDASVGRVRGTPASAAAHRPSTEVALGAFQEEGAKLQVHIHELKAQLDLASKVQSLEAKVSELDGLLHNKISALHTLEIELSRERSSKEKALSAEAAAQNQLISANKFNEQLLNMVQRKMDRKQK
jgi:hypothetical protein